MRGNGNPMVFRIKIKDEQGRVVGEKDCINYAGLLELAHRDRLKSIETTLIQAPCESNRYMAIIRAVVETSRGTFSGIGDATPENVAARVRPHFLRMAETRAISRAIRSAVNIGAVSVEELGDDADAPSDVPPRESPARSEVPREPPANDNGRPAATQERVIAPPVSVSPTARRSNGDSSRASDNQRRFAFRLLAERGITGQAARDLIHKELGVDSIQDASKQDVSAFIDRLKTNGHNGQSEPGEMG